MKISFINLLAMLSPSRFRKVIVNPLQPLTQMEHRVAFARKQRIYAHAGAGGEFLETQALDFVRDEDFALLRRQLAGRQLECGQEHAAGVERFRAGVGRRQQVFELQRVVVFVFDARFAEEHRFLLAEEIDDAIAGHAKEPADDVVDGHQQAIRFHEFVEDVLQNVLGVARVGDAAADEVEEPGAFAIHDLGDSLILICHSPLFSQRCVHLLMKTDERGEYCREE
jgi:hypothetical protein